MALAPQVSILWDLDNKPPPDLSPFSASVHLKETAAVFGNVRETLAFANRHAFEHVPAWVRDERRDRKILDILEHKGAVSYVQPNPYACRLCGRKCKTNLELKRHFKQLHERERNKQLARLKQLKGKRREILRSAMADSGGRYMEAARDLIVPEMGYYLASDLRRAGVWVRKVQDKPEAADEAIKRWMSMGLNLRDVIVLVSDDSGFSAALRDARNSCVRTVVVGDRHSGGLSRLADAWLPWGDVASGAAIEMAAGAALAWRRQEKLAVELLG